MPAHPASLRFVAGTRKGFAVKVSGTIIVSLLLLLALPLAAQINDTYVIPAVANVNGGFGTRWMSQISIFNPQLDHTLHVSVTWLPSGGGRGLEAIVDVPANSTAFADNTLLEIFNSSNGTGALLVATFPEDNPGVPNDVVSRSFLVTTNTVNKLPDGGTFGQTIPGIWTGLQDYTTDGISAVSHGIRHIARFGWRTNFGAVNLGSSAVDLRIRIYDKDGRTVVKDRLYGIPAQAHMQWSLPVEVDQGAIEFFVDDPSKKAVVFPYTSTLDRYTGDPMYQSPPLLASAKILFKGAPQPATLGKKIDIDFARAIRAEAIPLGHVELKAAAE
jgi:hypothetical protein